MSAETRHRLLSWSWPLQLQYSAVSFMLRTPRALRPRGAPHGYYYACTLWLWRWPGARDRRFWRIIAFIYVALSVSDKQGHCWAKCISAVAMFAILAGGWLDITLTILTSLLQFSADCRSFSLLLLDISTIDPVSPSQFFVFGQKLGNSIPIILT